MASALANKGQNMPESESILHGAHLQRLAVSSERQISLQPYQRLAETQKKAR
jgi:hypothetical protein